MNASITVEVKKNDFKKLAAEVPRKTSAVVRKTAFDIIKHATPNTPVDTGFLRLAVTVAMLSRFEAVVYWAAAYAAFQEFGTRSIAPKLFATGAAETVRPFYERAIKEMLESLGS